MLPELPRSSKLPISSLAASFDNVTNSYKFYWFLAILQLVTEEKGHVIKFDTILARMIASAWYPVNYFRLSFGKQDQLGVIITILRDTSGLSIDSSPANVTEMVLSHLMGKNEVGQAMKSLLNYVPYRFLRPFFTQTLRGARDWEVNRRIYQLAEDAFHSFRPCIYRFVMKDLQPAIEIHPTWFEYLQQNLNILTGFCLWHLVNYLQKNNPNVPNIAGKLFEPQVRDLRLAREFWNFVLSQSRGMTCIYSGQPLLKGYFSLDHFLPWRFVAHDLLWNLIPAPRSVNSAKSDCLPDFIYFEPFVQRHYHAVQTILHSPKADRFLEDYVLLFKVSDARDFSKMSFEDFRETLQQAIAPQMQIAANMGFVTGWKYVT
jgi:hypothetical protein